ncbi:hypothetical protein, partial [Ilumatobacter sp.]|uniref:hypothetical protein n=1 Tax=Ilumatobacter sp. TaxID=1967498 RepID=UPI003C65BDA9
GTTFVASAVARVQLRYDETKADLVHDDEFECVLFPLTEQIDASLIENVDYDDRDLRPEPTTDGIYRLTEAKIANKTYWTSLGKAIRDQLVRTSQVEIGANAGLKLYGRPGEDEDAFRTRCLTVAEERADAEVAKLRDKYETKAKRIRERSAALEDRIDVLEAQSTSKRNSELFSTAGSVLGGLLGGKKSKGGLLGGLLGDAGSAARRRGTTRAADERVDEAENKLDRLQADLDALETELADEVAEITDTWIDLVNDTTTLAVGLEANDVKVTQISLTWIPVT